MLALHTPKRRSATNQFVFQRRTPATEEASTGPSAQPQDDTSANIVHDSPSPADAKTGADTNKTNSGGDTKILQIGEEQREDVDNQVNLEEKIVELDQGQAGSDPGKTPESRPPPEQVFMEQANKDEFLAEKDKSRKRRCDDQDPPPPPPNSDLKAPSSSYKQKSAPHSEQPVEDVPIPDDVNVSGSEDTVTAHLPKIKTRPNWLKPVPEEDRPATPEPDWVIPPDELLKPENNWANALASSYQDPNEYKLL
ncbi:hypothetical protein Tco_1336657 [Tanacetum coccineum]